MQCLSNAKGDTWYYIILQQPASIFVYWQQYIRGLVQKWRNSSAYALELRLFCS